MVTLKGKGFILRPFKISDALSLQENINDSSVYRYTLRIPYPYSIDDAKKFISSKNKNELSFAIVSENKIIGGIGFDSMEKHKANIGYWLAKKYRNYGIMTLAIKLLSNYGLKELNLKRIQAIVFVKNKASERVLQKCGFKKEGLVRNWALKNGKLKNAHMYSLIP